MATGKGKAGASSVPSAWDDDWEKLADVRPAHIPPLPKPECRELQPANPTTDKQQQESSAPPPPPAPEPKLTRAERKARHQEANAQLWASA
jgi:hypothetical protein